MSLDLAGARFEPGFDAKAKHLGQAEQNRDDGDLIGKPGRSQIAERKHAPGVKFSNETFEVHERSRPSVSR